MKIKVLDKGYVKLIDHMGNDDRICEAARTSTNSDGKDNKGLIDYLVRNAHTSPLEFVVFTFKIKCPIFVFRHIVRHRMASINEVSGRYSVLKDEFWFPGPVNVRKQSKKNMQMTNERLIENADIFCEDLKDFSYKANNKYKKFIENGVCREQARTILPVNIYTKFYWKIDLHNLLHFLKLRNDKHAQEETREFAKAISRFVNEIVPFAFNSFDEHVMNSTNLSKTESQVLLKYINELGFSIDEYEKRLIDKKISKGRLEECLDKLKH